MPDILTKNVEVVPPQDNLDIFFLGRILTLARAGGFYARQVARQECGALGIEASDAGQECDAGKHKSHLCFRSGQVGGFYAGQARQWSAMKNDENFNMSIRHVEAIRFQGQQGGRPRLLCRAGSAAGGFYAGHGRGGFNAGQVRLNCRVRRQFRILFSWEESLPMPGRWRARYRSLHVGLARLCRAGM